MCCVYLRKRHEHKIAVHVFLYAIIYHSHIKYATLRHIHILTMPDKNHLLTKVAEYAMIFNPEGKILILQFWDNHNNTWHFPGGRLEHGDESVEALKREVKEETGLDIVVEQPFFTKYFDENSPKYGVFFLARVDGSAEVTISDEHQAYRWIGEDEVDEVDEVDWKQGFYGEMLKKIFRK